MNNSSPNIAMTVEQAAAALGISRNLAYQQVKCGRIPSVRLGRRLLIPVQSLEAALMSSDSGPTKELA